MIVLGLFVSGGRRVVTMSDDVLADIDATVDGRCACGCGAPLDPAGPSGWFASPECQTQFAARDATDPLAVWMRRDAADYPVYDGQRVPLSEPGHPDLVPPPEGARGIFTSLPMPPGDPPPDLYEYGFLVRAFRAVEAEGRRRAYEAGGAETLARYEQWLAIGDRIADRELNGPPVTRLPPPEPPSIWDRDAERRIRAEEGWQPADGPGAGHPLSWFRWCDRCQRSTQPRTGLVPPPFTWLIADAAEVVVPSPTDVGQYCPRCRTRWPGPLLIAQWREGEFRQRLLRLSAPGWGHVTVVADADDSRIVEYLWRQLELSLLDSLTFRASCDVGDCTAKARARFRVRGTVTLPSTPVCHSFANTDFGLCPRHESDLLRAQDAVGLPVYRGGPS